jgi:hypothetical protein
LIVKLESSSFGKLNEIVTVECFESSRKNVLVGDDLVFGRLGSGSFNSRPKPDKERQKKRLETLAQAPHEDSGRFGRGSKWVA